ncbi:V-type ATP synthase subunit I [Candidatus Peregrinibacteria bacterium]|jgi:V/A-type H+/Na+-transporting ATPase subunit I|nr:V-type ATP synthase subunit I [Candidatus Peregrinibacteria bacterium]MBT7736715.1 V-type ATP synthase subunit I [Candidatus Peregrinibacteria bacterium]
MALAKIKKIQLIGSKSKKSEILEVLQDSGAVDIIEIADDSELKGDSYQDLQSNQKTELAHANVEFAIKLLNDHGKKRGILEGPEVLSNKEVEERVKNFDYEKIVEGCTKVEEKIANAKNNLSALKNELSLYTPWKKLEIPVENIKETVNTKTILGSLKTNNLDDAKEKIIKLSDLISLEVVNKGTADSYLMVIFEKELEREIRQVLTEYKFSESELPKTEGLVTDYLKTVEKDIHTNEKALKETDKELKELGENIQNLHVVHDYLSWKIEKTDTDKKLGQTEYSFMVTGWMQKKNIDKIKGYIDEVTNEYELTEIPLEKDEIPPVELDNNKFLSPFEAVSKIYGLPKSDELDPTPFLAAYFIVFFALCLTDAGYGLVMFFAMLAILKFFKLADGIKKLVTLLMYGGIVTFIIGALFGGWFGLTPEQVPQFLTYAADNGEQFFVFQKINALTNPIAVLILALSLGFIQVLMGVIMKFVHTFRTVDKKEALLESGTWVFLLSSIGFMILTMTGVLPESLVGLSKNLALIGVGIIIVKSAIASTVGAWKNKKGGIVGKFISSIFGGLIPGSLKGVLGLYDLVGYMSDILSYSRMLALGLATAIIGLAVNIVAGLVLGMPYVGWLLAAVVFVGGHIFNLLLNALGSFIHSGRLQFVEFFTKFMEGGGDEFKPFSKKTKYIFLKK